MTKSIYILLTIICMPFIMYSIVREQHVPCDQSNRINKIRLFWFACTRSNIFNPITRTPMSMSARLKLVYSVLTEEEIYTQQFPWLMKDEYENITNE